MPGTTACLLLLDGRDEVTAGMVVASVSHYHLGEISALGQSGWLLGVLRSLPGLVRSSDVARKVVPDSRRGLNANPCRPRATYTAYDVASEACNKRGYPSSTVSNIKLRVSHFFLTGRYCAYRGILYSTSFDSVSDRGNDS